MALVCCFYLAGCHHAPEPARTGTSSFSYVEPPAAPPQAANERAALQDNRQYRDAVPADTLAVPLYPRAALAAKFGAATVGVRVTIDVHGRVTDVRPSLLVFSTPGRYAPDFLSAVETALRTWKFFPAAALDTKTVTEAGKTFLRVVNIEPVEAEFDLAFNFTATGGVVSSPVGR